MTFIIPCSNNHSGANGIHRFNTMARIFDTVTTTRQDFLITGGVQIGEAFGELHFLTIDGDGPVGRLLALHGLG